MKTFNTSARGILRFSGIFLCCISPVIQTSTNHHIGFARALHSNHVAQQVVDLVLPVAEVTAVHEVVVLLAPAAGRRVQLERPQEVRGELEVGADGEHLVHQILDALDVLRLQLTLDAEVVGDRDALALVLDESTLVDQLPHGLLVRVAPGDVRLNDAQHVDRRLVQLDEHTVVDLTQAEQLQHLAHLRRDLVDTVGDEQRHNNS